MTEFLRLHFEVWLIAAFGLMLLDYLLTLRCRRVLKDIAPELAQRIGGASRAGKYFAEMRFIFAREYRRLGNTKLNSLGNAVLAARISYFAWFAIGLWAVFQAQR